MTATARKTRANTVVGDARAHVIRMVSRNLGHQWPSERWRTDPVGFAYNILGVRLWRFQEEFLEAIRDHRHVACAGGRKIGKDFVVAVAALWWFASWKRAKVFMLAPTATQLDQILYLEIRQLIDQTGRCVDCKKSDPEGPVPCPHSAVLTGDVSLSARTGVRAPGFRQIFGKTAARPGNLRGFSGSKLLAIEDEASDIKDELDATLVGNLASADCHRVIISNPDKPYGFFYRAFHEERDLYHTIQQSSEETPNVVANREIFPGLASREWLEERERAWGRGTALWAAHVEGKFPTASQGQLFTLEMIKKATSPDSLAKAVTIGRLHIGGDVAGAGQDGDESAFAVRRADLVLELLRLRGLTADAILVTILGLLNKHRTPTDGLEDWRPIVTVDRDGEVGARVFDVMNAYRCRSEANEREFELLGFQGGAPPLGLQKDAYKMNRDLMYGGLVEWMKDGGTIPEDLKLQGELVAHRWKPAEGGKTTLEHKSEIRKRLGRSPDSADALALSTWKMARTALNAAPAAPAAPPPPMDPYAVPSPYG